jgi:serine/threonine-protein kinase
METAGNRTSDVERAGEWRLGVLLGRGGTASVYRGEHPDGRVGAVKVMHAHFARDREWITRLRREARVLGSVEHPGLVRLIDEGQIPGGSAYFVMELLEGYTLEEIRCGLAGSMPITEVLEYADEVLGILVDTHALGIVHRDLKPSNVFVTDTGSIKVLDFGIAAGSSFEANGDQPTAGGTLGTLAYMAPEQARGRWDLVDHRSDLWAVGAMIFTLASGQYVHLASTKNERRGLAMSRPARSLASVLPNLPPSLVKVVNRSLEYEVGERWQSACAFREALATAAKAELVFASAAITLTDADAVQAEPPGSIFQ